MDDRWMRALLRPLDLLAFLSMTPVPSDARTPHPGRVPPARRSIPGRASDGDWTVRWPRPPPARAPKSIPDRRPWFFKTVMGRGLVCLLTKVIPILLPVVWFSLVVMGMLPNPLALFDFSTDPQPSLLNPANGCFWLLLVMFIVVVLHDSLPALLRRLGWMMDKPKTASASLTSMVESHYGVSNLEVDWFGAAAGGVPPFDGLYSCRYDTGRRRNNGVLRVRNHRVWLYGPDGCEEERHGH